MKQLIWIFLFGKIFLLTDMAVNIEADKWFSIKLDEPIKAITGGAAILVQIPITDSRIQKIKGSEDVFKELKNLFPKGSVEAELTTSKKEIYSFKELNFQVSDFSFSKEDSVRLTLSYNRPVPTDVKFTSVRIKSLQPINNAKIYWKNYTH